MNLVDTSLNMGTMSTTAAQPVVSLANAENFGAPHFRCLGVGGDGNTYFFQPTKLAQIIELPASALRGANMFRLAPLYFWESECAGRKDGVDWNAAANACVQNCIARGVFNPKRIIGSGVTMQPDTLAPIVHLGNRLHFAGRELPLDALNHAIFVEREAINLPVMAPLAIPEARRILTLFEKLDFLDADMARLFAGATVIGPFLGALDWRPHLWVIGPPGSGKTFAINDCLRGFLGDFALSAAGAITEAGIRQTIGPDMLPILLDESEAKDDRSAARVASILELARSSASRGGAEIRKGSSTGRSTTYRIRSMFVFSSVDPAIVQTADESRVVQLELKAPPVGATADDLATRAVKFSEMRRELAEMQRAGYGHRLFWRSLELLPRILLNAQDLAHEITARTGNSRLADVVAPLIAGWFSLTSDKRILPHDAAKLLDSWAWLRPALARAAVEPDHVKALQHLLSSQLILDGGVRRSIGELVDQADQDGVRDDAANEVLKRHGFKVDGGRFLICRNSSHIRSLFATTQWRADPVRVIAGHPSAETTPNPIWFGKGVKQRAVAIPLGEL